jgi:hypothetical protein
MDPNFYRFRSEWRLVADPDDAYVALAEVTDYPSWWPEVVRAQPIASNACALTCRSWLPYDLAFVTRQRRRDPDARVLEAELLGDLEGFSRWTITASGRATIAVFDEEVVVNKELLRRLAPVARPVFQLNHALMMRHGERGLRTYLAGFRLARAQLTADA